MSPDISKIGNYALIELERSSQTYTCDIASELALRCESLMRNMGDLLYAVQEITDNDTFSRNGKVTYFDELASMCDMSAYLHKLTLTLEGGLFIKKSYISYSKHTTFTAPRPVMNISSTCEKIDEETLNSLKEHIEVVFTSTEDSLIEVGLAA